VAHRASGHLHRSGECGGREEIRVSLSSRVASGSLGLSDQPAGDGFGSTAQIDATTAAFLEQVFGEPLFDADGILDPGATLLGGRQEAWLATNLARSRSKWNVLAQQVMLMPWNLRETGQLFVQFGPDFPGKPQALAAIGALDNILNVDAWDGYSHARERLLRMLDVLRPASPVVLTGDIHSAWAADIFKDFGDSQNSDVLATELVCTSIASTFLSPDPRPTDALVRASLPANPHIRYFNGAFRGYCLCEVDGERWRTAFRAVGAPSDLTDPNPLALVPLAGDAVFTDAAAVIERDFNRRGARQTLRVEGNLTGAAS
jgi:alkaline phosphatase D